MVPFLMPSKNLVIMHGKVSLRARKVVVMGAKWRVGDGQSIKVFKDNWLPGLSGGKISSVHSGLDRNLKVAELMASNKDTWNGQVIDSYFIPHEA